MSDEKKSGEKTLKTLIALAGFVVGASSVVAWNNRKVFQDKAVDAKKRANELKEKTLQITELSKEKLMKIKEQRENVFNKLKELQQKQNQTIEENVTNPNEDDEKNN